MATVNSKDQIDKWISRLVPGKSFVDIGGVGEKAINERVTLHTWRALAPVQWQTLCRPATLGGTAFVTSAPHLGSLHSRSLVTSTSGHERV